MLMPNKGCSSSSSLFMKMMMILPTVEKDEWKTRRLDFLSNNPYPVEAPDPITC
jgi:hypothetical protein